MWRADTHSHSHTLTHSHSHTLILSHAHTLTLSHSRGQAAPQQKARPDVDLAKMLEQKKLLETQVHLFLLYYSRA